MTGNISKSKGFKGDPGKDGHTPAIVFEYDQDTGNLYYSSDGILLEKDYVESQNLVTKDDAKVLIDEQTKIIKTDVEGLQQQINEEAHFRGYLSTNAKIQAMAATPNDFAYSAESGTKWVYDAELGWQDAETPVPDQLTPASDATPLVNGVASAGQSNEYARGDHRHPTDTTRVCFTDYATYAVAGVVKVKNYAYGLFVNENGELRVYCAERSEVEEKASDKPVSVRHSPRMVMVSTHQDMSDDYDVSTVTVTSSYKGMQGQLPASYDAVKRYIDSKDDKTITFTDGETINVSNNTTYIAQGEISTLTIVYPDTNFLCSFQFTLASEGDITMTFPDSKYIGGVPEFANGETWELNIKNGVVVGGKVE